MLVRDQRTTKNITDTSNIFCHQLVISTLTNIVLEKRHWLTHFGLTMVIDKAVKKQDNTNIVDNKYVIFSEQYI